MTDPSKQPPPAGEQTIEQLQQRYQELNRKKIQAETQRDNAKARLDELKTKAKRDYGTDDVAELQKKLDDMIAENTRKRAEYQEDLDKIEKGLADVEAKFSDANRTDSEEEQAQG